MDDEVIGGGQNNKRSAMTLNVSGLWDVVPRLDHYRCVLNVVKIKSEFWNFVSTRRRRERIVALNVKINRCEFQNVVRAISEINNRALRIGVEIKGETYEMIAISKQNVSHYKGSRKYTV